MPMNRILVDEPRLGEQGEVAAGERGRERLASHDHGPQRLEPLGPAREQLGPEGRGHVERLHPVPRDAAAEERRVQALVFVLQHEGIPFCQCPEDGGHR